MKEELKIWTDVELQDYGGKLEFNVWGRKYIFDNSFLPTSILSQGKELLASPVSMIPTFNKTKSEWENFNYRIVEQSEEKVVMISSCSCENIVANATVTVEFDGFVKLELNITNDWAFSKRSRPELDGLYIEIPFAKEMNLFHFWPNNKSSITPAPDVMNSGDFNDITLPFKPCLWVGNENIGLHVFTGESDKNFRCGDSCINFKDSTLKITFLDSMPNAWLGKYDMWNGTLRPITYTFGFQATPVKQFKNGEEMYKRFHLYDVPGHNIYDEPVAERAAEAGVKWFILHEDWTFVQNYGMAKDEEKFRAFVKKCHDLGMKVMVYTGYEYSSLAPHWNKNFENYCTKTVDGNLTGGWQRDNPYQRAFMTCYKSGYTEEFFKRIDYILDEYGVDGIYNDGGYIPWECANEAHGCGYRDAEGNLHISYPVLAVRNFARRLYETVKKHGGMVDAHQSSCCMMPTLAFCDSYYDGENIQRMLTDADMSFLNLAAFRAEYTGINFGLPTNFLSYTGGGRTIEGLESLSLLHNVHTRANNFENLAVTSKIWKIFDELKLDSAKWHPYWSNTITRFNEDNAYTSVYDVDGNIVIYAVDFTENREITLFVPASITSITNHVSKETYKVEDGKVKLQLEMSRPYFFTTN